METAPFFQDIARAPAGGEAWWLTTTDNVRIRAAIWPSSTGVAAKGTVFLFPGRTEYIEKYGQTAAAYSERGFSVATVDWRGQGLADRAPEDPLLGHVGSFDEFQRDVAALTNLAQWLDLPEPWYLVGHSMGGCIGLRALHSGMTVKAAAFSAPMWGMQIAPAMRPVAWTSSLIGHLIGLGMRLTPGTERESYAATAAFEDNTLTSDRDMFAFLKSQLTAHPELALGGPTLSWLRAALLETTALTRMAAPEVPAVTFIGGNERIVEVAPVHSVMEKWSAGSLVHVDGAEHEILMERPDVRERFLDTTTDLFLKHV